MGLIALAPDAPLAQEGQRQASPTQQARKILDSAFKADPKARVPVSQLPESIAGRLDANKDGSLDREALGAIVFRDEKARVQLGSITHPAVIAEMIRRAKSAVLAEDPLVVLDIPLLFEGRESGRGSGAIMDFDATVCVWVSRAVQIERTSKRDDCDEEEAERRVAAQMAIDKKREMADHVIDNSGSMGQTVEIKNAEMLGKLKEKAEQNLKKRLCDLESMKGLLEEGEFEE